MIDGDVAHSESLGQCSRDARLTFFYLLTVADSHGRMRDNARELLAGTYPDDENVTAEMLGCWVDEIVHSGVLHRYEVDGRTYLHFPKWDDYQKLRNRGASRLPNPDCTKCSTSTVPVQYQCDTGTEVVRPEIEREIEVEGNRSDGLSPAHATPTGDPSRLASLLNRLDGEPDEKLAWLTAEVPIIDADVGAGKGTYAQLVTRYYRQYLKGARPHLGAGKRSDEAKRAAEFHAKHGQAYEEERDAASS